MYRRLRQNRCLLSQNTGHKLQTYIDQVDGKTMLFDAPLQMKFHEASR